MMRTISVPLSVAPKRTHEPRTVRELRAGDTFRGQTVRSSYLGKSTDGTYLYWISGPNGTIDALPGDTPLPR